MNCNVVVDDEADFYYTEADLSVFIREQSAARKEFLSNKPSTITDNQMKVLDSLSFPWILDSSERWDQHHKELIAFKERNGHCNVNTKKGKLGIWVKNQRAAYRKLQGKDAGAGQQGMAKQPTAVITSDQVRLLDEMGFQWVNTDKLLRWDSHFETLKEFVKEHGHACADYKIYPKIAQWITEQRKHYRRKINGERSSMTEERISKLESLDGWKWKHPRKTEEEKAEEKRREQEAKRAAREKRKEEKRKRKAEELEERKLERKRKRAEAEVRKSVATKQEGQGVAPVAEKWRNKKDVATTHSAKRPPRSSIVVSTAADLEQIMTRAKDLLAAHDPVTKESDQKNRWAAVAQELGVSAKVREKYARMHLRATQRGFDFAKWGHYRIRDYPHFFFPVPNEPVSRSEPAYVEGTNGGDDQQAETASRTTPQGSPAAHQDHVLGDKVSPQQDTHRPGPLPKEEVAEEKIMDEVAAITADAGLNVADPTARSTIATVQSQDASGHQSDATVVTARQPQEEIV